MKYQSQSLDSDAPEESSVSVYRHFKMSAIGYD